LCLSYSTSIFLILETIRAHGNTWVIYSDKVRNESIAVDPITGQKTVSVDHNPNTLRWGLAVEYSLIYLQQHVKDIGLKAPFDHLIPLVEFSMSTPLNRGVDELLAPSIPGLSGPVNTTR
jgi:hypothetical protein